jgi:hypothetical protein
MVSAAAAGFATHSRLLPLSIVGAGFIAVLVARRRLAPARAAGLLALLGVLLGGVAWWSRWIVGQVWEAPAATNTAIGLLARATHPGELAAAGVGQVWYELVATVGVAGLGTLAVVRATGRQVRDRVMRRVVDARVLVPWSHRWSACRSCS